MSDKMDICGEKWYVAEICNDFYVHRESDCALVSEICNGDDDDEGWDRANLMAAAPEMLALLEDIRDELTAALREALTDNVQCGSSLPIRLHVQIRQIISKARGLVNTSSVPLPGREEADND